MRKGRLFLTLVVIVIVVVAFTAVREMLVTPKKEQVEGSVVDEMLALIQQHSIYNPKKEVLVEGALKGMAQAIEDPYSTYYTETEAKLHEASLAEQKAGIGIEPHIEVVQHDVLGLERVRLVEEYSVGDYHSDISYIQRAMNALGYTVGEVNGYYGESLKHSVLKFKEEYEAGAGERLDEAFYSALQQQVAKAQSDEQNDLQLQMTIGYLMHKLMNE